MYSLRGEKNESKIQGNAGCAAPAWDAATKSMRSQQILQTAVKPCGACKESKLLDSFVRKRNGDISNFCKACEYPVCETCGNRSQDPLSASQMKEMLDNNKVWHCPDCPRCEKGCKEYKPKSEFARVMKGKIALRCLGCEYPKCHLCGYQHPRAAIAVQERRKIDGKWFCGSRIKCKEAAAAMRNTA